VYDIITVGSATVDVFADTNSQLVKFITNEGEKDFIAYPSGSKILISDLIFSVGGGGTNTAVSFSRLGLKTGFLGKLGTDENSFKVLHLLESEKIDFLGSREGQTGYSIILDSIERDRTILTFKGSNNLLKEEDLIYEKLQTKWLYSSSMIGKSFETLKQLFSIMYKKGVKIAFNPSSYQAKQGLAKLQSLINCCAVLVMNLEEARLILRKEGSSEELAPILAQGTDRYVIITNGPKGACCFHEGQFYEISSTPKLSIVESTGAGDAFASGFVTGLLKNKSLTDSLKLGMVQAESVIQAKGAKNNLLNIQDAELLISEFKGDLSQKELYDSHDPKKILLEIEEKYRFNAPLGKEFYFSNGKKICSLDELAYYLKFALPKNVENHIHENNNDFALWIQQVFNFNELAEDLMKEKDQHELSKILIKFIHTN
jgi:ribokinase